MHQQWLKKGHPKLSRELADDIRANARPPRRTLRKMLRVPFLFISQTIRRRRRQLPEPLDVYGVPVSWRHPEPICERRDVRGLWTPFEAWCQVQGVQSIPASPETVVSFLRELDGFLHQDTYEAIAYRHEQIYWHTGACPHCVLKIGYGLKVLIDGRLSVRPGMEDDFFERFG